MVSDLQHEELLPIDQVAINNTLAPMIGAPMLGTISYWGFTNSNHDAAMYGLVGAAALILWILGLWGSVLVSKNRKEERVLEQIQATTPCNDKELCKRFRATL